MNFFQKIKKNNKGDAEVIFFIFACLILILLMLFSMDLLRLTWQQYSVKREIESMSRLFAISWPEGIFKENGQEYIDMEDSEFIEDMKKLVEVTAQQGQLRELTISIGKNQLQTPSPTNVYLYIEYKNGTTSVSIPKSKNEYLQTLNYGDDLYLTAKVAFDYLYTRNLNPGTRIYTLTNKFANERYKKTELS